MSTPVCRAKIYKNELAGSISNEQARYIRVESVFGRLAVVVLVAAMIAIRIGHAQVPGPLEPTRPSEEFAPPLEPRAAPTPSVPLTRDELAPKHAKTLTLQLTSIRIEGAEALSVADLRDLWEPYLGGTVSAATLFEIVNGITRRYAESGYALSIAVLPEQRIENGLVVVRVVEGYVDAVVFTGDLLASVLGNGDDGRNVLLEKFEEKITASRPLRTDDLERYLLLMNDLPGVTARATFAASGGVQGASTMTVDLARRVRKERPRVWRCWCASVDGSAPTPRSFAPKGWVAASGGAGTVSASGTKRPAGRARGIAVGAYR